MSALPRLKLEIERHLTRIADVLPDEYVLTLVARHTTMEDADIILTRDDDLKKAVAALDALRAREG